ncbi:hypothetical protein ABI59_09960 [Acidobacteria bacterium Mor1]|nr:hypothetical protein ABI59_09960 [Acidobacteria bacterium Mor1]
MKGETIRIRRLNTPEGVKLPFEVASAGDRFAALTLDLLIVHLVVIAVVIVAALIGSPGVKSIGLLVSFFIRNLYFVYFEMRWHGSTPGKRKFGLRVISRQGGPLSAEAIFARNLTRELEVFLPMSALFAPGELLPGLPMWGALLGTIWLFAFGLLPLFNKDRLRVGDLIAGTLVVLMPAAKLLPDMTDTTAVQIPQEMDLTFSEAQLSLYGSQELQVLEDLMRKERGRSSEVLDAVAEKIKIKVDWTRSRWDVDTWEFLSAFYRAQRAHLEHKMLFGERRTKKKQGILGQTGPEDT